MAHYAFINEDDIVVEVITGRNEDEVVDGVDNWELHYEQIRGMRCKRTSYNSNIRKNFAARGFKYDKERDAFISPKPVCHADLVELDEETCRWVCNDSSHLITE
jgi:hypothetical protein